MVEEKKEEGMINIDDNSPYKLELFKLLARMHDLLVEILVVLKERK